MKYHHEIRDPVHNFVVVDTPERSVIDSRPVQRLRDVHQLATTYLIYPGATHSRFEHSLGAMHLAGRVFDQIVRPDMLTDSVRDLVPEVSQSDNHSYWRRTLRLAALCHDIGHVPFSHAAEEALLPHGVTHERLTWDLIMSAEMEPVWSALQPPVNREVIAKLAVGPKKAPIEVTFSPWENILQDVVTSDSFGVDRMDYLLRDSLHTGVAYGIFDHHRVIQNLRLLPRPREAGVSDALVPEDVVLGLDRGGLEAAESMLFARYFMFSQVYYHQVRRIYDIHLIDFMREHFGAAGLGNSVDEHLAVSDSEVLAAIRVAASDSERPGHVPASRIASRGHMRILYNRSPTDAKVYPEPGEAVYEWACEQFGSEQVRHSKPPSKTGANSFPVLLSGGEIISSLDESQGLSSVPSIVADTVYIDRLDLEQAKRALDGELLQILSNARDRQDEESSESGDQGGGSQ